MENVSRVASTCRPSQVAGRAAAAIVVAASSPPHHHSSPNHQPSSKPVANSPVSLKTLLYTPNLPLPFNPPPRAPLLPTTGSVLSTRQPLSPAAMSAIKQTVDQTIKDSGIVVWSKSTCPYCSRAKSLLKSLTLPAGVEIKVIE